MSPVPGLAAAPRLADSRRTVHRLTEQDRSSASASLHERSATAQRDRAVELPRRRAGRGGGVGKLGIARRHRSRRGEVRCPRGPCGTGRPAAAITTPGQDRQRRRRNPPAGTRAGPFARRARHHPAPRVRQRNDQRGNAGRRGRRSAPLRHESKFARWCGTGAVALSSGKAVPHRSATDSTTAATAGSTACSTSPASPSNGSTATPGPTSTASCQRARPAEHHAEHTSDSSPAASSTHVERRISTTRRTLTTRRLTRERRTVRCARSVLPLSFGRAQSECPGPATVGIGLDHPSRRAGRRGGRSKPAWAA